MVHALPQRIKTNQLSQFTAQLRTALGDGIVTRRVSQGSQPSMIRLVDARLVCQQQL